MTRIKLVNRWVRWMGVVLLGLLLPAMAQGAWHEGEYPFRRQLTIDLNPEKISGQEVASARFLGNGKQRADGMDLVVTTHQGKAVPFRLINAGPGDLLEIAFNPVAGVRDYFVYFGSGKPAEQAAALNPGGLLFETKAVIGEAPNKPEEMLARYEQVEKVAGRRILSRPFLGSNPLGVSPPTMARLTGKLFAPETGNYTFAVAGDYRSALFIDGQATVFAKHPARDARFQETIHLDRGQHDFSLIHASGGEFVISVAWKRPDSQKFEVIGREFFTMVLLAEPGPLEEQNKPLVADMTASYMGEAFFNWNYSHRLRFESASTLKNADRMAVTWEMGDGQKAEGRQVEHVYLAPGVYTVRVTARLGGNSDTQAFRIPVDRDVERIDNPPTDGLPLQSRFVATYDLTRLGEESLAYAVMMHLKADAVGEAVKAGHRLVAMERHEHRATAVKALRELDDELTQRGEFERLRDLYAAAPAGSDLQPDLAAEQAGVLIYRLGRFDEALKVIEPFGKRNDLARRPYGQALLLSGQMEKARAILEGISVSAAAKTPALSGALARSAEFYVEEKDAAAGEGAWEKWMAAFPADFLDGNAALLRARLMLVRGNPGLAAAFSEAYASANSQSAYAPRLLELAAGAVEKTTPEKARQLRATLKARYPEDPLSQK